MHAAVAVCITENEEMQPQLRWHTPKTLEKIEVK